MDDIMQAQLIDVLNNGNVEKPETGGVELESIGGGQFRCNLPDGRVVIVDQLGNIIG